MLFCKQGIAGEGQGEAAGSRVVVHPEGVGFAGLGGQGGARKLSVPDGQPRGACSAVASLRRPVGPMQWVDRVKDVP